MAGVYVTYIVPPKWSANFTGKNVYGWHREQPFVLHKCKWRTKHLFKFLIIFSNFAIPLKFNLNYIFQHILWLVIVSLLCIWYAIIWVPLSVWTADTLLFFAFIRLIERIVWIYESLTVIMRFPLSIIYSIKYILAIHLHTTMWHQ